MRIESSVNALSGLFATEQPKNTAYFQRPPSGVSRDTVSISQEAKDMAALMRSEKSADTEKDALPVGEPMTEELLKKHERLANKSTELGELDAEGLRKRFSELISQESKQESLEDRIKRLKQKLAEMAQRNEKTKADEERIKALQEQIDALEKQLAESDKNSLGGNAGRASANGSTNTASGSSFNPMAAGKVSSFRA